MISNSLLCAPISLSLSVYLHLSLFLSGLCLEYADRKGNNSKLSWFLSLFLPFLALIYIFFSKKRKDEKGFFLFSEYG